jgi:hypothetical protein
LANDALESGNEALLTLVGAQRVTVEHVGNPPSFEWHPPAGVPRLSPVEPLARELAGRLVAKETARAEAQPPSGGRRA